jgi:K+-sensing histidine kinase KdpD
MIGGMRRQFDALLAMVMRARAVRGQHLALLWLSGSAAIVVVTWVCFALQLNAGSVGFAYLIVVVLLSLFDSFISSSIFSFIAVACLDFFFTEPLLPVRKTS